MAYPSCPTQLSKHASYWAISWTATCLLRQLRVCYGMGPRHGHLLARMRKLWTESTRGCSEWHSPWRTMSEISTCMTNETRWALCAAPRTHCKWTHLLGNFSSHGKRATGRPYATFLDTLKRDTGLSSAYEIRTLMEDRDAWHATIRDSRVGNGWGPCVTSHRIALCICMWYKYDKKIISHYSLHLLKTLHHKNILCNVVN